jgi:predicted transglutaminase-like cysteine proteinase
MFRVVAAIVAILSFVVTTTALEANPVEKTRAAAPASFMRVYAQALPPYGFVHFCERTPGECAPARADDHRITATADRLAELDEINRVVNRAIRPVTDIDLYGVTEHWTLPVDAGDCEDYVLLKRHILIKRGWSPASLLITVVRDEKGEGHAILTARTSIGDMVLDNKVDDVKLWSRTPYTFVMRQSYLDPRAWVSLDPKDAASPSQMAGVRGHR